LNDTATIIVIQPHGSWQSRLILRVSFVQAWDSIPHDGRRDTCKARSLLRASACCLTCPFTTNRWAGCHSAHEAASGKGLADTFSPRQDQCCTLTATW